MTRDTRFSLIIIGDLDTARRANEPDTLSRLLNGGIKDHENPAATELLQDLIDPFLPEVEQDRLLVLYLGVSLDTMNSD